MRALVAVAISLFSVRAFPADTLQQHQYKSGEVYNYFFEDTETDFNGEVDGGIFQPSSLYAMQELQIPYTISILSAAVGGKT